MWVGECFCLDMRKVDGEQNNKTKKRFAQDVDSYKTSENLKCALSQVFVYSII